MTDKLDLKIIKESIAIYNDKTTLPSKIHTEVINCMVEDLINIIEIIGSSEKIYKITPYEIIHGENTVTRFEIKEPSVVTSITSSVSKGYFIKNKALESILDKYDI